MNILLLQILGKQYILQHKKKLFLYVESAIVSQFNDFLQFKLDGKCTQFMVGDILAKIYTLGEVTENTLISLNRIQCNKYKGIVFKKLRRKSSQKTLTYKNFSIIYNVSFLAN